MCRRASLDLTPDRRSPALARQWVSALCEQWCLEAVQEELALATSELVTNAVLHARTAITADVCVADGVVEVQVADGDPTLPIVPPVRQDLESDIDRLLASEEGPEHDDLRHASWVVGTSGSIAAGRGLHLLESVSETWGVMPVSDPPGKVVWFSVRLAGAWTAHEPCRCPEAVDRCASGRTFRDASGPWPA